jgi:hypothetical protein
MKEWSKLQHVWPTNKGTPAASAPERACLKIDTHFQKCRVCTTCHCCRGRNRAVCCAAAQACLSACGKHTPGCVQHAESLEAVFEGACLPALPSNLQQLGGSVDLQAHQPAGLSQAPGGRLVVTLIDRVPAVTRHSKAKQSQVRHSCEQQVVKLHQAATLCAL